MMPRNRKQYRVKKKRSFVRVLYRSTGFLLLLAGITVSSLLGYALLFFEPLQVRSVEIAGAHLVEEEELRSVAEEHLSRRIGPFETRSILFASIAQAEIAIREVFPQIKTGEFSWSLPNVLSLNIQEREPFARWCREEGACFVVDAAGVVYERADEHAPELFLLFPRQQHQDVALGDRLAEPRLMAVLEHTVRLLSGRNDQHPSVAIQSFSVVSAARVNARTSERWEFYIDPRLDYEWQLIKLQAVLEKEISPDKRDQLQYIDLRFRDQVYVYPEEVVTR